jgi:hypothetical protein
MWTKDCVKFVDEDARDAPEYTEIFGWAKLNVGACQSMFPFFVSWLSDLADFVGYR